MHNSKIYKLTPLWCLVGYLTYSTVGFSQELPKLLYVGNLDSPSETATLDHLVELDALDITVVSDSEVYAGYDFGLYKLIVIADTSPGITDVALDDMKYSGVPIFVIASLDVDSYVDRLEMRTVGTPSVPYAVYSTQQTYIRNNVTVENGLVGGAGTTDIGVGVDISGDVESVGAIHIANNTEIDGNVISAAAINFDDQNTVTISGDTIPFGSVTPKSIPTRTVAYGGETVTVYGGQTRVLAPGQYASLEAFDGAHVVLSAGDYRFGSFIFQAGNGTLDVDTNGGTARIDVQNEMRFGDRNQIGLSGNGFMEFYTNYSGQVKIGTDSVMYGSVTAPNGQIYVFSRSEVHGSLGGKQVYVDTDSLVAGLSSGDMSSGELVYMYDTCHPVTFVSDLFFDAYTDATVVNHGTSFDNLYSDISVLVVDEDRNAVVLLDDYNKIMASSLSNTNVYTHDSWVVFDQILNYLAPLGVGWNSYDTAWNSVVVSGILDFVDTVVADPYLFDYEDAVVEAWRLLAREDLAFLRYWTVSILNWAINEGSDPAKEPFAIYDAETLQQYMDGDFVIDPPNPCTCLQGCDTARTSAGTLNTTQPVCYEISNTINNWSAWWLFGRTIQVNGTTVTPGATLPGPIDGKYYFYFSAGPSPWTGWTYQ